MANSRRTSNHRIREVLTATVGNVTAAAKMLGIAKNSLYKRLRALELQPAVFRMGVVTPDHLRMGDVTPGRVTPPVTHAQKSETDTFPRSNLVPSFSSMRTPSRALDKTPKATAERALKNLSLPENHLQAISRARRRLAAALDLDLTDADLLQQFIDDKFEDWGAYPRLLAAHVGQGGAFL